MKQKKNQNAFFNFMEDIGPLNRYLLSIIFLASLFSGWYFCIYYPLQKTIARETKRLTKKLASKKFNNGTQNSSCTIPDNQTSEKFLLTHAHDPHGKELQKMLANVIETTCKTSLLLTTCTVDKEIIKNGSAQTKIYLSLIGAFGSIIIFFEQFNTIPYLLSIEKTTLTKRSDGLFDLVVIFNFVAFV